MCVFVYVDSELQDVHRTGAKVVPGAEVDSLLPGVMYHTVGVMRTKPGMHAIYDEFHSVRMLIWCQYFGIPLYLSTYNRYR